ncbi:hypothetical protein [Parasphingorhabdus halotolerans]|uniref:Uncharacterized protein n=1 Tax=Parasphingorhabdus halotolerans TaxID=2725558 RepID=A0A6H2DI68_9SPHN|nr:hypothetical protein [Parasphingorhabdus halotolerans]QJB68080.1 hypothetical protein HF685_01135 [Parasphingorhabdus halotolerans]
MPLFFPPTAPETADNSNDDNREANPSSISVDLHGINAPRPSLPGTDPFVVSLSKQPSRQCTVNPIEVLRLAQDERIGI